MDEPAFEVNDGMNEDEPQEYPDMLLIDFIAHCARAGIDGSTLSGSMVLSSRCYQCWQYDRHDMDCPYNTDRPDYGNER